jgi:hypothetical protein
MTIGVVRLSGKLDRSARKCISKLSLSESGNYSKMDTMQLKIRKSGELGLSGFLTAVNVMGIGQHELGVLFQTGLADLSL